MPPIWVECMTLHLTPGHMAYLITAKTHFKNCYTCKNVEIMIPLPAGAYLANIKAATGSVKYVKELNAITWAIESFPVSIEIYDYFIESRGKEK